MKRTRLHLPSFLSGLFVALLAALALSNAAPARSDVDYQIIDDVDENDLPGLAKDGWEYAGYLGQGKKGSGNDQTLWRRDGK
jgi:purine nucleoside permease